MQEQAIQCTREEASIYSCKQCNKLFELEWELKRHAMQCRLASSSFVRIKKDGWYHCGICPNKERSPFLLKSHVFREHSEAQVQATYNRSMESFIGKNVLDRLQTNILKMIKNGQLDPMIVKLLSRSEPFDDANIKYDLPIPLDDDPVNK